MHTGPAANTAIGHCRRIACFTDEPGLITRTFLSPAMRECLAYFIAWAKRIGMQHVRVDAAGNFRAFLPGSGPKTLVIGSHLDSVPNAGAFDGVLGVVLGMMIAESFQSIRPACNLEIVGFSEEEGVRFQKPFIGSTAFVQGLNEEFLNLADTDGLTVRQAIANFGLDAQFAGKPQRQQADAYLEFHIEQGPVLENLGHSIAVVEAIAGQTRAAIEFTGKANHAGTTPMNLRQDAFCGAAEWALLVERAAQQQPGLVATVGSISIFPDAGNIVPGRVSLSLDLRHAQDDVRSNAFQDLLDAGRQIAARRRLQFHSTLKLDQNAVSMDRQLLAQMEQASEVKLHRMTSGAGHDAMIIASQIPSAMIFLRTPQGLSHHPDENVSPQDVEAALTLGRAFVDNFI